MFTPGRSKRSVHEKELVLDVNGYQYRWRFTLEDASSGERAVRIRHEPMRARSPKERSEIVILDSVLPAFIGNLIRVRAGVEPTAELALGGHRWRFAVGEHRPSGERLVVVTHVGAARGDGAQGVVIHDRILVPFIRNLRRAVTEFRQGRESTRPVGGAGARGRVG